MVSPRVDFLTSQYEFAHGHAPRGRGAWAFEFITGVPIFVSGPNGMSMTYGEAKKIAIALARAGGITAVEVCS